MAEAIERLEARTLFAATLDAATGVLSVTGTAGDDHLSVLRDRGRILVRENGRSTGAFVESSVQRISMRGYGGNDTLLVGGAFAVPVRLDGAEGNDTITGGSGGDVILGGLGRDVIYALNGDDWIDPGSIKLAPGQDDGWADAISAGIGRDKTVAVGRADNVIGSELVERPAVATIGINRAQLVAASAVARAGGLAYARLVFEFPTGGYDVALLDARRSGNTFTVLVNSRRRDGVAGPAAQYKIFVPLGQLGAGAYRVSVVGGTGGIVGGFAFTAPVPPTLQPAAGSLTATVTTATSGERASVASITAPLPDAYYRLVAGGAAQRSGNTITLALSMTDRAGWQLRQPSLSVSLGTLATGDYTLKLVIGGGTKTIAFRVP